MSETAANGNGNKEAVVATENSSDTSKSRFTPQGKFAKGIAQNPGGRPKGLARLVREQTKDGEEMVNIMLEIMRGTHTIEHEAVNKDGEVVTFVSKPSHKDIRESIEWLSDRGWGRPVETVDLTSSSGLIFVPLAIQPAVVIGEN